jgi:hypothetical protein
VSKLGTRTSCYTETVDRTTAERLTNVTISLPASLVREARHLAVDQGVSLSRFVARALEERVDARRRYRAAWEQERRVLDEGIDLDTHGHAKWTREALHER